MLPISFTITVLLILVKGAAMNNTRPVIGILSQEVSDIINAKYDYEYHSIIAASYVKFVEGAGARVVPIWIGKNKSYYEDVMSKINGVLLPGGVASFDKKGGYADAAKCIYWIAKKKNDDGTHFPILGICLGFELLVYIMSNSSKQILTECDAENISLPLNFTTNYRRSNMFEHAPKSIVDMLSNQNLTFNVHKKCVTLQQLLNHDMGNQFQILSTNHDRKEQEFISSLEVNGYPFYGLQFHPEKNLYEWKTKYVIPHGINATLVSQFFANFFVNEARKNSNRFRNEEDEISSMIYNYRVQYTAQRGLLFQQSYLFKESDTD